MIFLVDRIDKSLVFQHNTLSYMKKQVMEIEYDFMSYELSDEE